MFVDAVTFRLIHMSIPDLITWCHSTYCLGEPQNPPWFGVWTIFQIQKCHWCSPFQTQTRLIHSYIYYICIPAHAGHIFNYIYIHVGAGGCVCVSRCATVSWQSSIHFMVMDSTPHPLVFTCSSQFILALDPYQMKSFTGLLQGTIYSFTLGVPVSIV